MAIAHEKKPGGGRRGRDGYFLKFFLEGVMPVDYRDSVACEYGCRSSLPAPDFLAFFFS